MGGWSSHSRRGTSVNRLHTRFVCLTLYLWSLDAATAVMNSLVREGMANIKQQDSPQSVKPATLTWVVSRCVRAFFISPQPDRFRSVVLMPPAAAAAPAERKQECSNQQLMGVGRHCPLPLAAEGMYVHTRCMRTTERRTLRARSRIDKTDDGGGLSSPPATLALYSRNVKSSCHFVFDSAYDISTNEDGIMHLLLAV